MNRLLGIGAVAAVVVGFLSFKKVDFNFSAEGNENCAMCGVSGNFKVEDLPIGPRWFCTEKHFAEYAGLPVKEFGYYGFEAEESKKLVQCKGHLPSCKKMIDPNRTWWIDEKGEGWPALDEYGEEGYCDDCIGYSIDSHSRALGQGHDAESKKLPPVEKAIDTGIASGATMEGLDLALAAEWADEHPCEHCGSTDIDYGNNWKCHDCGRYAAEAVSVYYWVKTEMENLHPMTEPDLEQLLEMLSVNVPVPVLENGMEQAEDLRDEPTYIMLHLAHQKAKFIEKFQADYPTGKKPNCKCGATLEWDNMRKAWYCISCPFNTYKAEENLCDCGEKTEITCEICSKEHGDLCKICYDEHIVDCPHCEGDGGIPRSWISDSGDRWNPPSLDVTSFDTCEYCEGEGKICESDYDNIPQFSWDAESFAADKGTRKCYGCGVFIPQGDMAGMIKNQRGNEKWICRPCRGKTITRPHLYPSLGLQKRQSKKPENVFDKMPDLPQPTVGMIPCIICKEDEFEDKLNKVGVCQNCLRRATNKFVPFIPKEMDAENGRPICSKEGCDYEVGKGPQGWDTICFGCMGEIELCPRCDNGLKNDIEAYKAHLTSIGANDKWVNSLEVCNCGYEKSSPNGWERWEEIKTKSFSAEKGTRKCLACGNFSPQAVMEFVGFFGYHKNARTKGHITPKFMCKPCRKERGGLPTELPMGRRQRLSERLDISALPSKRGSGKMKHCVVCKAKEFVDELNVLGECRVCVKTDWLKRTALSQTILENGYQCPDCDDGMVYEETHGEEDEDYFLDGSDTTWKYSKIQTCDVCDYVKKEVISTFCENCGEELFSTGEKGKYEKCTCAFGDDFFDVATPFDDSASFSAESDGDKQLDLAVKRTKMSAVRTGLAITTFSIVMWNLWTNKKQEKDIADIMDLV